MEINNRDEARKIDKLWSFLVDMSKSTKRPVPKGIIERLEFEETEYNIFMELLIEDGLIVGDQNFIGTYDFRDFTNKGKSRISKGETFENDFLKTKEINKKEDDKEDLDIRVKQDTLKHNKMTRLISYFALIISVLALIFTALQFFSN